MACDYKPRLLAPRRAYDGIAYDYPINAVDIPVALEGLANQPVVTVRVTALEAVALAEQLLAAARHSGGLT